MRYELDIKYEFSPMNMDMELKPPEEERIHEWNLLFSKKSVIEAFTELSLYKFCLEGN